MINKLTRHCGKLADQHGLALTIVYMMISSNEFSKTNETGVLAAFDFYCGKLILSMQLQNMFGGFDLVRFCCRVDARLGPRN